MDVQTRTPGFSALLREERFLPVSILTGLVFFAFGDRMSQQFDNPLVLGLLFPCLFTIILVSSLSVVRHADHLAEQMGEPYGTLILTLTITSIEVVAISAVMFHGENNPTLVRDTLFAVVMIILNGMVGLSLLLGAWRRPEQRYNLQGANAYLGVIVPLAVISLILPEAKPTASGPALSTIHQAIVIFSSLGLYCLFLVLQTGRHSRYFAHRSQSAELPSEPRGSLARHAILLFAYMIPVVYLVDHLARPVDYLVETLRAPAALGGVVMAVLVATPEAISAVRAAVADHLQRSVNIFLGSVLSTIGLTVPAMLVISQVSGNSLVLQLGRSEMIMLVLTLAVSMITFASGRTNLMQGAVHLMLFVTFLMLILQG